MNPPGIINSIEGALNIVRKIRDDVKNSSEEKFYSHKTLGLQSFFIDIWFRGENEIYTPPLIPVIFRHQYDETAIMKYLPTYCYELREIGNDFEKLCYMQHYGVPTRLLDWTDNILVALYFAVKNNKDKDGKLFILNSRLLNTFTGLRKGNENILTRESLGTKFRCIMAHSNNQIEWDDATSKTVVFDWKRRDLNIKPLILCQTTICKVKKNIAEMVKLFSTPIAVRPDQSNKRIFQQSGLFTLHGGKNDNTSAETDIKLPPPKGLIELNEQHEFLKEFVIPGRCKKSIEKDLLLLQVHSGRLFPELEKQKDIINLLGLK